MSMIQMGIHHLGIVIWGSTLYFFRMEMCPPSSSFPAQVRTMTPDPRFQTKTIIITGAGGNFGREGCIFFICRGANVAALDVNEAALKETLDEVNGLLKEEIGGCDGGSVGCSIKGYTCDVTSSDSVDDTVQSIVRDFGQIDMLW